MRLLVLGFLLLIGVIVATALFLASRSPHSEVISSEMHEIDANTQSLDISWPSSAQQGRRINVCRTPQLLILRCAMAKPIIFKTVFTAMKQYKERAALGGKCDAWTDFAEHSRKQLGQLSGKSAGQIARHQAIRR